MSAGRICWSCRTLTDVVLGRCSNTLDQTGTCGALLSVFGDRYEIKERLGKGGMAAVYRAFDTVQKRDVALKALEPSKDAGDVKDLQARFEKEAETARRIKHPRIPTFRALKMTADSGDERTGDPTFLVQDIMPGVPLHKIAARRTATGWARQSPGDVITFGVALLDLVSTIHDADVVHRDITPSNILLPQATLGAPDEAVLTDPALIDFGLARAPDLWSADSQSYGTPGFCAPELFDRSPGAYADSRYDIYSVGAVLYYLLGRGQRPFPDAHVGSELGVGLLHLLADFQLPRADRRFSLKSVTELDPLAPKELDAIFARALAPRDERYATARDFQRDLAELLDGVSRAERGHPLDPDDAACVWVVDDEQQLAASIHRDGTWFVAEPITSFIAPSQSVCLWHPAEAPRFACVEKECTVLFATQERTAERPTIAARRLRTQGGWTMWRAGEPSDEGSLGAESPPDGRSPPTHRVRLPQRAAWLARAPERFSSDDTSPGFDFVAGETRSSQAWTTTTTGRHSKPGPAPWQWFRFSLLLRARATLGTAEAEALIARAAACGPHAMCDLTELRHSLARYFGARARTDLERALDCAERYLRAGGAADHPEVMKLYVDTAYFGSESASQAIGDRKNCQAAWLIIAAAGGWEDPESIVGKCKEDLHWMLDPAIAARLNSTVASALLRALTRWAHDLDAEDVMQASLSMGIALVLGEWREAFLRAQREGKSKSPPDAWYSRALLRLPTYLVDLIVAQFPTISRPNLLRLKPPRRRDEAFAAAVHDVTPPGETGLTAALRLIDAGDAKAGLCVLATMHPDGPEVQHIWGLAFARALSRLSYEDREAFLQSAFEAFSRP